MIVAEQVVAALEGGLVTNAVNIPADPPRGPRRARPVGPARREARPARDGARRRAASSGSSSPTTAALSQYDTRLLTVAALNGAFQGRVRRARQLRQRAADRRRARDRGARGARRARATSRTSSASPCATATSVNVAGTTIGRDNRLWLVAALGFELDIELAPLMVFFRYDDVPGVIGRVGTLFGEARRQHREHDRVAHAEGRQGADGALDRHPGRPPSSSSRSARRASTTPASSTSADESRRRRLGRARSSS